MLTLVGWITRKLRLSLLATAYAAVFIAVGGCASNPPVVRTQTVEVATPVIVAVPEAYTQPVPMPVLKSGQIVNQDIAEYVLALKQAIRDANERLRSIAGLKPVQH